MCGTKGNVGSGTPSTLNALASHRKSLQALARAD